MNGKEDKSPHILNTSSNLLGICFLVLTYIKALKFSNETVIDSFTTFAIVFFMTSSLLSFLSMKSNSIKSSALYETIADYIFLAGLFFLFVIAMLISFDLIK